MKMGERRRMLAIDDMPPAVDDTFDMRSASSVDAVVDAFKIMLNARPYVMRVVGPAPMGGEYIELIMDERPAAPGDAGAIPETFFCCRWSFPSSPRRLVYLALHYIVRAPDAEDHRQT